MGREQHKTFKPTGTDSMTRTREEMEVKLAELLRTTERKVHAVKLARSWMNIATNEALLEHTLTHYPEEAHLVRDVLSGRAFLPLYRML